MTSARNVLTTRPMILSLCAVLLLAMEERPTKRPRKTRLCMYGEACYRTCNADHCAEFDHPHLTKPVAPAVKPECMFGSKCYRTPDTPEGRDHLRRFRHPAAEEPAAAEEPISEEKAREMRERVAAERAATEERGKAVGNRPLGLAPGATPEDAASAGAAPAGAAPAAAAPAAAVAATETDDEFERRMAERMRIAEEEIRVLREARAVEKAHAEAERTRMAERAEKLRLERIMNPDITEEDFERVQELRRKQLEKLEIDAETDRLRRLEEAERASAGRRDRR